MAALDIHAKSGFDPSLIRSFNIGTRQSKLALVQTEIIIHALKKAFPDRDFQIHARDTAAGDIDKVTPFKDMPVKNIWTHELEQLMLENKLDLLVHSLKDVPTQIPPSCAIGGITTRADPRDALVVKSGSKYRSLTDLPAGAVVGTSSIRRTAQIALKYPHLRVKDLRGNIDTRLRKLDAEDGPYDAIILAAAGLLRINRGDRITQPLDSSSGGMLYAVGQGAIGVEFRATDQTTRNMLSKIEHKPSSMACIAERSLLSFLEGGCSAPLGVETKWIEKNSERLLQMNAIVVSVDGKSCAEAEMLASVETADAAEQFGRDVAAGLLRKGADRILAEIQAKKITNSLDLKEM